MNKYTSWSVNKFKNLLKRFELCEKNKTILVCHYTNIDAFKSILSTRKVYWSDYRDMNDFKEFIYARDVLRPFLYDKFFERAEEYRKSNRLSKNRSEFDQDFESMLSYIINRDNIPLYYFCASKHEINDDDGLLTMWRAYGGTNSGVGIVMKINHDEKKLQTDVVYSKTLTDQHKNELQGLVDRNEFINYLLTKYPGQKAPKGFEKQTGDIAHLAFKYKHPGFKDEREYRIARCVGYVCKRQINNKEIRYISVDLDTESIEKIIIGPSIDQHELHRQVQMALEFSNLNIPVVDSSIPFLWDR